MERMAPRLKYNSCISTGYQMLHKRGWGDKKENLLKLKRGMNKHPSQQLTKTRYKIL